MEFDLARNMTKDEHKARWLKSGDWMEVEDRESILRRQLLQQRVGEALGPVGDLADVTL
jgi:hypothetical protein